MRTLDSARRCPPFSLVFDSSGALAFTLIESVAALVLVSVIAVGLFALCPLGMRQIEMSLLETRGAYVAQSLFATLRSCPYTAVDCFGTLVDLSTLQDEVEPLLFYWSEGSGGRRGGAVFTEVQPDSRYTLKLHFRPLAEPLPGVEAQLAVLSVTPLERTTPVALYEQVIVRPARL